MPLSLLPWPSLRWTIPSEPRPSYPLPPSITRSFVPSGPNRELELLTALPTLSPTKSSRPPIFLIHGGFGGAFVWVEWMTFLQRHGYTCYAMSLRGHGESWNPGFWRMTWGTSLTDLAQDVRCVWDEVLLREEKRRTSCEKSRETEPGLPVLVGHSSGGGLSQFVLGEGLIRAEALVLCGSIPGFGGFGVHLNWAKLDPWFIFREYLHLMHPRSPLSSTALVQQAFFSPQYPRSRVQEWQRWMPEWESLRWPIAMMRPFVAFSRILGNLASSSKCGPYVCIIAGSEDKLVGVEIPERLAKTFRDASKTLAKGRKIDGPQCGDSDDRREMSTDRVHSDISLGVRFVVIEGAPHHFQNDVEQELGARQLLGFVEELK